MMNYNDKPIKTAGDDFLGHAKFAADLAKAISSYNNENNENNENNKDSLVLGLMGQWGSGKTSIINLVEEEMKKSYDSVVSKPILTIRFEPWNISNQDNLISQFFAAINYKLKNPDINEVVNKTGKAIKAAANAIGFFGKLPIPVFSDGARVLAPLLKEYSDALTGLVKDKNLVEIKQKIENQLIKLEQKLLIIIDDIDRLNIKEIAQIFQLVKAVADFPNTIYLLSFERDTVVSALANGHVTDGEQYLEKMIQIPFEVPMAPKARVREKFSEEVLRIGKCKYFDWYYKISLSKVVFPFLVDIRKMYRLLALFRFKYDAIGEEVNETDLLNICAIEIFRPDLFNWIKRTKDILTASIVNEYSHGLTNDKARKKEYANRYAELLEEHLKIESLNNKINKEIIEHLFPNSYFFTKNKRISETDDDKYYFERERKIASPKYFDLYFTLRLETNELSKMELENLTYVAKKEEVVKTIGYDDQKICEYMDYILYRIAEPKYEIERTKELIDIMLVLRKRDLWEEGNFIGIAVAIRRHQTVDVIYRLLENITKKNNRMNILQEKIENAKPPMFEILEELLSHLEYEYKNKDENGKKDDDLLLNLEDIEELKKELKNRGWICSVPATLDSLL